MSHDPHQPFPSLHLMTSTTILTLISFLQYALPFAAAQFRTVPAPPPPDGPSYNDAPKFSPPMGIVMVVLVVFFFLIGFCSVYIRRCAQRRFGIGGGFDFDSALNFGLGRAPTPAGGLDVAVIESFPTFVYSEVKDLKIGKVSLECAVCLNEFQDDETLRLISHCSHVFHPVCIDSWLSSHSTCPVCRAYLVPNPGELTVPYARLQVLEPDVESHPGSDNICIDEPGAVHPETERSDLIGSPADGKLMRSNTTSNQRRPHWSKSSRWRFTDLFPRSHSTGHSLIQSGDDIERFTLRLPEVVRNELLNSRLNRTRSCVVFPSATSTKRGYRNGGTNDHRYNRFDPYSRLDRSGCFPTSPMFSRAGSVRSSKREAATEPASSSISTRKELFKSIKRPLDRLKQGGGGGDNVGERSSDRLKPDDS